MCDLRDGFRLCTCAPDEAPGWWLERRDPSRPLRHRRGRAMRPRYGDSAAQICAQLNARPCFDFDFEPQLDDVLILRQPEGQQRLRFRFGRAGWALDESTSLTGWRAQMVPLQRGCVAEP